MKTSLLFAAIVACAMAAPVVTAQDGAAPVKMAKGMDTDRQMSAMQVNMKEMQRDMERIHATTDPKERQKLLQEHMQAMQQGMKTMHGMAGPMMAGGGPQDGTAAGGHKDMAAGEMMQHHQAMEQRIDMMQMMMEQMMQHEQVRESMPAK
jgi:hypothetical protein